MGLEGDCGGSVPCSPPHREGRTHSAKGLLHIPFSEELEFLSLVHVRQNLPDTSMWIFNTSESKRTTGFSAALF